MFAGIVKGVGQVARRIDRGADLELGIDLGSIDLIELTTGASIAVNGVCLTATRVDEHGFDADVSAETLRVTTLGGLVVGDKLNLEPSLRLGDPIDGHLVYGHVDAVGELKSSSPAGRSVCLEIEVPEPIRRYLAPKGSVAVDGVSLTVNTVSEHGFSVNIVPYTREATIISGYAPGTPVNIEVDRMARYLDRLRESDESSISIEKLREYGFASND